MNICFVRFKCISVFFFSNYLLINSGPRHSFIQNENDLIFIPMPIENLDIPMWILMKFHLIKKKFLPSFCSILLFVVVVGILFFVVGGNFWKLCCLFYLGLSCPGFRSLALAANTWKNKWINASSIEWHNTIFLILIAKRRTSGNGQKM